MNESMTQTDARSEYIAGLRKLADALEADPALRLPQGGSAAIFDEMAVHVSSREEMAAWARLLVDATEEALNGNYYVRGRIGGVYLKAFAGKEQLGGTEVLRPTFEVEPFLPQPVSA